MNDLNSVLIEGRLTTEPELAYKGENSRPVCRFTIASKRCNKVNDKYQYHISHFNVITYDRLADMCTDNLSSDRGVRVVGRLVDSDSKVVIVAEHVEFKPEKKEG